MSDQTPNESTQPAQPQPVQPQPVQPAYAAAPQPVRLGDRMLGLRAVAAVAVASLLLGGLGGAALAAISDGHGRGDPDGRGGPGMSRQLPRQPAQPGGQGQLQQPGTGSPLPPATAPDDDQDS